MRCSVVWWGWGADLVPREVVEKWLAYFRAELPAVAFKCSTQKQAQNLSQRRAVPGGKGAKNRGNKVPTSVSASVQAHDWILN